MEKVNVIFKWVDDIEVYNIAETAYKLNENYIFYFEDDYMVIDSITSETETVLIVDMDDENYKSPINIYCENVNGIDLNNEHVINFAKYLLKLRDENLSGGKDS